MEPYLIGDHIYFYDKVSSQKNDNNNNNKYICVLYFPGHNTHPICLWQLLQSFHKELWPQASQEGAAWTQVYQLYLPWMCFHHNHKVPDAAAHHGTVPENQQIHLWLWSMLQVLYFADPSSSSLQIGGATNNWASAFHHAD